MTTSREQEWQGNNNCTLFRRAHQHIIALLVCICATHNLIKNSEVTASQASPIPYRNHQPDGNLTPWLNIEGGPSYHRVADEEGYTIVVDEETREYVYGRLDVKQGKIVPSGKRVGEFNKTQLQEDGIEPKMEPTAKEKDNECGKFCSDKKEDFDRKYSFKVGGITIKGADHQYVAPPDRRLTSTGTYEGVIRSIVILMRFSDHKDRVLPSLNDFSFLFNGASGPGHVKSEDIAPTGSVKDVFKTSSYNKLELASTIVGWVNLPETEAYYADGTSGSTVKFEEALRFGLDILDMSESVSFDSFDRDGDKQLDSLVFIHSGYAAEWGAEDCHGQLTSDRIWSHKWRMKPSWKSKSGIEGVNYYTSSGLWGSCGSEIARIGTLAHELGHVLDLPDLYLGGSGIGSYGLMGNSWGFDHSQLYPPILSSWSKIQLNWIDPIIVKRSGRYTLNPIISHPEVLMIELGFPNREYLLIENRQPIGFEVKLPKSGLVIYHIDEYAKFNKDPGWKGQEGWPENGDHYRVAILQADGNYDLEKGDNRGDASDMFDEGDELGSGSSSYPNTDAYRRNYLEETGIRIYDIVKEGEMISVSIDVPVDPNAESAEYNESEVTTDAPKELSTTFAADIGSHGAMFDVVAGSNPIIITSLDLHVRAKDRAGDDGMVNVKVFSKKGSHKMYERDETAWTLISESSVKAAGYFQRTVIKDDDFEAVTVHGSQTHALYVVLDKADLRYSKGERVGAIAASNSDLAIHEGVGIKGFFDKTYAPRVYNGFVKYRVIDNAEAELETASETIEEDYTMTSNYQGRNGNYGNMFNIFAKGSAVTIRGMDVHLRRKGNVPIEVYTKAGGYQGHERNELAWELVCRTNVDGQGSGKATTIHATDFTPVRIEHMKVQSFYVSVKTRGDIRYGGRGSKSTFISDTIEIRDGAGVIYPFAYGSSNIYQPRGFNGMIRYSVSQTDIRAGVAAANTKQELMTTFAGENGSFGVMVDVNAKNGIILEGIDIHTSSQDEVSMEFYTKEGTHVGHERNMNSWTQICTADIIGKGSFERTSLPNDCFSALTIPGGTVLSLYVTLKSNSLRYTNEEVRGLGEIYEYDDEIEVMIGSGVGNYPIAASTSIYPQRIFNGVLKYTTISQGPKVTTNLQPIELRTTIHGGNRGYGSLFSVVGKDRELRILSIDIHTRIYLKEVDVEVWTRLGSYEDYTGNMGGWELVTRGMQVLCQGEGSITPIDRQNFHPVEVLPGQTRSFYVTLKTNDIVYSNGKKDEEIVVSDDGLTVKTGSGVFLYPLGSTSKTFNSRVFNGNINYEFV